jgi:hypothetical protein
MFDLIDRYQGFIGAQNRFLRQDLHQPLFKGLQSLVLLLASALNRRLTDGIIEHLRTHLADPPAGSLLDIIEVGEQSAEVLSILDRSFDVGWKRGCAKVVTAGTLLPASAGPNPGRTGTSPAMTSLLCACGQPRCRGQRFCRKCRREYQTEYRRRKKSALESLQVLAVDHPATRALFEAKSKSRWVLVQGEDGSDFPGKVIGFLPSGQLQVLDTDGTAHVATVEKVVQDLARVIDEDERIGSGMRQAIGSHDPAQRTFGWRSG